MNFILLCYFHYADILSDNEVISVALNYIHYGYVHTECTQKPLIHTLIQKTKHVTNVLLQRYTAHTHISSAMITTYISLANIIIILLPYLYH